MAEIVRGQGPGNKDTLSTLTLQQLLERLKDGTFKPGQKLPSQNELVEQFGVSRTGIREAMQMLAALNLIEIRAGLGCFVKSVSPEYVVNAEVMAVLLEKEALYEVIETRKIVESGIAALAAQRAKTEDFWRMEDVLTQIDRRIQCNETVAGVAAEFHYALALGSQNTVLTKLVRSFIQLMTKAGLLLESSMESNTQTLAAFRQHELQSHRDLYLAVKAGDPAKASQAMIDHISHSQGLIVHTIELVAELPEAAPELAGEPV
jgi:GntR family transcriptional repressor for pyruvate dehydrogenase complex